MTKADLLKIKGLKLNESTQIDLACGNTLKLTYTGCGYYVEAHDELYFANSWNAEIQDPVEVHKNVLFYVAESALPALAHIIKALAQKHRKAGTACTK